MAQCEEWDAQKKLDQYIYDYLVRKNLLTSAEIFAKEANVDAEPIVEEEPDGFLKEWWYIFWEQYSSGMPKQPESMEGSSAKATQIMGNEQLNHFHGNLGLDNMLLGKLQASLFAATIYDREQCGLPAIEMNSNQQLVGVDNLVHSHPSSSNARETIMVLVWGHLAVWDQLSMEHQKRCYEDLDLLMRVGIRNSGNSTVLNGGPLTGTSQIPFEMEYPVLNSFVPAPNQLSWFRTPVPRRQQEMSSQAMENENGKQISSFKGSTNGLGRQMFPTNGLGGTDGQMMMRQTAEQQMIIPNPKKQAVEQKMTGPVGISLEQKQKNRLSRQKLREKKGKRKNLLKSQSKTNVSSGTNAEVKKSSDDDIESIFSPDNANADIVSTSFGNLKTHSTACSLTGESGFFIEEVASLKSSKGKILCCDFSFDGKLLASAGDDKEAGEPLGKLLGHSGQVNSLDFHPKGDILCSCDSNAEIKLWTIDEFVCTHTIKGATRQVRFQPRSGTLLAAASGNGISLFDVETNTLQYSLEGHVNEVKSICWDTSGKYMASVSEESARLWSIGYGGKCVHELQSNDNKFESCTFHPGYSNVLIIGSDQSFELWNSIKGNKTLTVPAHNGVIAALAYCTETKMVASASHDQCIKLWK
ncbi:hypothetical protein Vadar_021837 [Vaccinium darrowii]|uniref:Uncharacterized protein n=1 Tax=Vaccinium darrowii TaxID=229202 RepID=A0ACB7XBL9_9ERIC|nr:hypothetical protein Vadar_021837 [Vaccinium darrowii]